MSQTHHLERIRRCTRAGDDTVLGGVAGGVAAHLGVSSLWVRVGFVLLGALGGLGVALYAVLWLVLPTDERFDDRAPGLAAATRDGRRRGRFRRLGDAGPAIALGALGIGIVLAVEAALGQGVLFWPLVIAAAGVAVLWRQADEVQRERWRDNEALVDPLRSLVGAGGWAAWTRLGVGLALGIIAMGLFALSNAGSLAVVGDMLVAGLVGVLGLSIVVGPWLYRLASDLGAERAERVRSQERADMAAHLHDSVLQTLALIQKNAQDPVTVARLARAQERDLRTWLFEPATDTEVVLSGALRAMAAGIEDAHGISVDVVTVGDLPVSERIRPLIEATGEALTNAAKHAGVDQVDLFAEANPRLVEVFVRDRGVGFDPATVAADRLGVQRSIVDRMGRHGGTGTVRSAPGEGTEVRLGLPLEED